MVSAFIVFEHLRVAEITAHTLFRREIERIRLLLHKSLPTIVAHGIAELLMHPVAILHTCGIKRIKLTFVSYYRSCAY